MDDIRTPISSTGKSRFGNDFARDTKEDALEGIDDGSVVCDAPSATKGGSISRELILSRPVQKWPGGGKLCKFMCDYVAKRFTELPGIARLCGV